MSVQSIYDGGNGAYRWRGHVIWKNPVDLLVYAEIVHEVRPTLVIETGTHGGGSALFWLDMMRLCGIADARVLSADIRPFADLPTDPSLYFVRASSTSEHFTAAARSASEGQTVLVNLDSAHDYGHVSRELELLGPLVSPGSYLIVEDGIDDMLHGRQAALAASCDFLIDHPEFTADRSRERLSLTNCPEGYLLRA